LKIKIALIPLLALLIASLAVSVACASPEKVAVTGIQLGSTAVVSQEFNNGGVYFHEASGTGSVTLSITGQSAPLVLVTTSQISLVINTKTNDGVIHFVMKWAKMSGGTEIGAFSGQINGKTETHAYLPNGYPNYPAQTESFIHAVLQGSGIYKGETLMLEGTRVLGEPLKWEGFLLAR